MVSAETSALVAGGMRAPAGKPPAPIAVRIVRGVMLGGQRVEPGAELDLPPVVAAELVSAGKATRITPAAPAGNAKTAAKKAAKENTSAEQ